MSKQDAKQRERPSGLRDRGGVEDIRCTSATLHFLGFLSPFDVSSTSISCFGSGVGTLDTSAACRSSEIMPLMSTFFLISACFITPAVAHRFGSVLGKKCAIVGLLSRLLRDSSKLWTSLSLNLR